MATTVQELKARHEAEAAALMEEIRIREWLEAAEIPAPRMVHLHSLYGMEATLAYGDCHSHGKGLSWSDVAMLAEKLPAMPLRWINDGCVSIKTAAYVDALPEEKKAGWKTELDISPVWLDADAGAGYATLKISWVALVAGKPVEIECQLRDHRISCAARRVEYHGGFRYEDKALRRPEALDRIHTADGEPLADIEMHRMWSAPEAVGSYKCIWLPLGGSREMNAGDVARLMLMQP